MKLLLVQYLHYTQVVFPMLAQEYNWTPKFDRQFQFIVTRHVAGRPCLLSRRQLKSAVSFCRKIASKPQLMHEIA